MSVFRLLLKGRIIVEMKGKIGFMSCFSTYYSASALWTSFLLADDDLLKGTITCTHVSFEADVCVSAVIARNLNW